MIAQPGRKVLVMALVAGGLVTWRELKEGNVPPAPHAYAGLAIVYGFDSVLAELNGDLAVYFGAAWTLFIAYTVVQQNRQLPPLAAGTKPTTTRQPVAKPGKPKAGGPQPAPKPKRVPVRSSRTPTQMLPARPRPRAAPRRRIASRQPIVRR